MLRNCLNVVLLLLSNQTSGLSSLTICWTLLGEMGGKTKTNLHRPTDDGLTEIKGMDTKRALSEDAAISKYDFAVGAIS